jgi:hypothetical protein
VALELQEAASAAATARLMPQGQPVNYSGRQLSTGGACSPAPSRQRGLSVSNAVSNSTSPLNPMGLLREEKVLDQVTETSDDVKEVKMTVNKLLQAITQMGLEKHNGETEERRRLSEAGQIQIQEALASFQASLQDQSAGRHAEEMTARATRAEEENAGLRERLDEASREISGLRSRLEAQETMVMQSAAQHDDAHVEMLRLSRDELHQEKQAHIHTKDQLHQTQIRHKTSQELIDSKQKEVCDLKRQVSKLTQEKYDLEKQLQAEPERAREREKQMVQASREQDRRNQERDLALADRETRLAEEKKKLEAEKSSRANGADKENKELKKIIVEQKKNVFELETRIRKASVMATITTPGEFLRLAKQREYEGNFSCENDSIKSRNAEFETEVELLKAESKALWKHLPREREGMVQSTYRELVHTDS